MEDKLITFELAHLAKRNNFNIEVNNFLKLTTISNPVIEDHTEIKQDFNSITETLFSRPTQSLLQKWFREIHKIDVFCDCVASGKYYAVIYVNDGRENDKVFEQENETDYETALEIGLKKAFEYIV